MGERYYNFGYLLIELREQQHVTLEQLCDGICTPSQLSKIEKGERVPDIMTQNRLLDRLGMSRNSNGSFLFYDDYEDWNCRWAIIDSIENEDGHETELLESYLKNNVRGNKIKLQFYLVMKAQFLIHINQKRNNEDWKLNVQIKETYEEALKLTVPNIDPRCIQDLKLSIEELNLILEYINICFSVEDEGYYGEGNEKIIDYYLDIIKYVGNSTYNIPSKAKIYPKIVVYMYRQVEKIYGSEINNELYNCMFILCNIAIGILRKDAMAYYLYDVLSIRSSILKEIINRKEYLNENRILALEKILQENEEWLAAICEIYEEYGISKEWYDSCYIYKEQDVQNIGNVICRRRRMLGMTRKEMYEGICSDKTLERLEKNQTRGQIEIVSSLFDRLNLSLDYQYMEVISNDRETIELFHQMKSLVNNNMLTEAEELILELRNRLVNHTVNEQLLHRHEIAIKRKKGIISAEEYIEALKEGLEKTVSIKYIYNIGKEIYLSNAEASYVYSISLEYKRQDNLEEAYRYISILYEYFKGCKEKGDARKYISMYEYVMKYVASLKGRRGEYEESDMLSQEIIKECLSLGRLKAVHKCIYNIASNINKMGTDRAVYKKKLYQCIILSQLCKDKGYEREYRKRYEKLN